MLCLEQKRKKDLMLMETTKGILNLLTLLLKRMFRIMKRSFLTLQSIIVYKFELILAEYLKNVSLAV